VKQQIHTCRDDVDLEQKKRDYKEVDKRVKASAKADKKKYLDEQAETAEKAAGRSDLKTLYNTTNKLCRKMSICNSHIKDRNGKILHTANRTMERTLQFCLKGA
jgi:hypothetical protein